MRFSDSNTMKDTSMAGGGPTSADAQASEAVEPTVKTLKTGRYQVLPALTEEEYEALKASIAAHGILVPIEVDEQGNVLEGHHRVKAARELGIPDERIPTNLRSFLSEEEKLEFVLRVNLVRRHLTREQKQVLAVQLRQQGWTQERIAGVLGVSQQTVSNWLRDVTKIGDVAPESGKPGLPLTITDTLGRRQPARKPRRQSSAVVKRPDRDKGSASPGRSAPQEDRPAEAPSPARSTRQPPAPVEAPSTSPAELPPPGSAVRSAPDGGVSLVSEAEPAASPVAPAEPIDAWAYLRQCLPERLPEPGPLDADAYPRAVALEAALGVLGRIVRQAEEGRRVVRVWRIWREHHGDIKALDGAVRLLEATARHLKTLGPVPSGGVRASSGRQRDEA